MESGCLSILDWAAKNSKDMLRNFYKKGYNSWQKGVQGNPYAFVIPQDQGDRLRVSQMVEVLRGHRIEIGRLTEAVTVKEGAFAKGDYAEARAQARKAKSWWWWSPDPWRLLGDIAAEQGDSAAARDSYRKAIAKDEGDWRLWYDLSTVTTGEESRLALAEAVRRNRYATSDFEEAGNVPR